MDVSIHEIRAGQHAEPSEAAAFCLVPPPASAERSKPAEVQADARD